MAANKTAFQIWAVDAATPTIVGARSVLRVKTTTPAAGEKIALWLNVAEAFLIYFEFENDMEASTSNRLIEI